MSTCTVRTLGYFDARSKILASALGFAEVGSLLGRSSQLLRAARRDGYFLWDAPSPTFSLLLLPPPPTFIDYS